MRSGSAATRRWSMPRASRGCGPDGKPTERTLLFPKSSATIHDVWQVVGLKGTGSDSYTVTDVFVPARYTFTRESAADRRENGPLYRFTTLSDVWRQLCRRGARHRAGDARRVHRRSPRPRCRCWRPSRCARARRCSPKSRGRGADGSRRARFVLQTLEQMWDAACARRGLQHAAARHAAACRGARQSISPRRSSRPPIISPAARRSSRTRRSSGGMRDIHAVTQQVQSQILQFRSRRPGAARPAGRVETDLMMIKRA